MAGIYIHIPFCKQKCSYCNFHFSTSTRYIERMTEAIAKEIKMRSSQLAKHRIDSVYFGGGTPSILSNEMLLKIFHTLEEEFDLKSCRECTLEANPDDLSIDFLSFLKNETPVNRLSIGIQSFLDRDLKLMNRSHTAMQARKSLERAKQSGFEHFNLDLIFGIPGQSREEWERNIKEALQFQSDHLSAYALTIEEKTAFHQWLQSGKMHAAPDEEIASRFLETHALLADAGYEHYEISNYALNGNYALHNTSYWKGTPYLGIGPSAHSYDKKIRSFNIANNAKYLRAIEEGRPAFESELLTSKDQFNEFVMTRLRTMWGLSLDEIHSLFPEFSSALEQKITPFLQKGYLLTDNQKLILTPEGMLLSDYIISELFEL